jgi:hypothetical protein
VLDAPGPAAPAALTRLAAEQRLAGLRVLAPTLQGRFHSLHLALQINARMERLSLRVHSRIASRS